MNRRDFLKLIVLVPAALAVKVEPEAEITSARISTETLDLSDLENLWGEIGQEVFEGYVEGMQAGRDWSKAPGPEDTYTVSWTSEEADPLADLKAMQDFMLEERGIPPLLMPKRFEHLFSEKDKSGIRFI